MDHLSLNEIQTAALAHLGIESLTPMQEASLFACREPQHVILLSPTGTGKTLAYLLPLMERLEARGIDNRGSSENHKACFNGRVVTEENGVNGQLTIDNYCHADGLRAHSMRQPNSQFSIVNCQLSEAPAPLALVVVPSRELAQQIEDVFKSMRTPWNAMAVYGGRPAMDEHRTLRGLKPRLVIGTPGRLNDHIAKGNIHPGNVSTLVIDEFDKCLELGFHDEMQTLLGSLPATAHRWLMSATDAPELPDFVGLGRRIRLDYRPATAAGASPSPATRITTYVVPSPEKDKLLTLYRLLCSLDGSRTIVFCNYRDSVERVAAYLREQHIVHAVYHGGLEQDQRERALYRFRNGSVSILVSTDLASRGLDIPDVRHIVHYHLPLGEEASIHRTGRTARWDADGNTYYILGPGEPAPAYLTAGDVPAPVTYTLPDIPRRPAPPEWETLYIGKGKKDKLSKTDIAGFLYKKGHLTNVDVGRIDIQEHYSYVAVRRTRVRQLLALVSGEKIKGMKTIIDRAR